VPSSVPVSTEDGILVASVSDLVQINLISFHLKVKVHLQNLDSAGLIIPETEAGLSDQSRLAEVRASEWFLDFVPSLIFHEFRIPSSYSIQIHGVTPGNYALLPWDFFRCMPHFKGTRFWRNPRIWES